MEGGSPSAELEQEATPRLSSCRGRVSRVPSEARMCVRGSEDSSAALLRPDLEAERGETEESSVNGEITMIWHCFKPKNFQDLPELEAHSSAETEEYLAAWYQQKFRLKETISIIGLLELLLLISMSCNAFQLDYWLSKEQLGIFGGILVFLLLAVLFCYIYLAAVRNKPKFRKKHFDIFVGFMVLLLLILIIALLVSNAVPQEHLPSSLVPPVAVAGLCPIPWIGYGKRCYFFSADKTNWTHSQSHCMSQGGSLVTLETPEEKDFIERQRERIGHWIGLWREGLSEPWMRPDGSLFNQTFPIKGEGLCAYLNGVMFSSTWCTNTRFWICSKPVT